MNIQSGCKRCQDLIYKERCLVCNRWIDICKRCLSIQINEFYSNNYPSSHLESLNLEWISILKSENSFCNRCIQTGLYLIPSIDSKRTIPYRIYCLIKRKRDKIKDESKYHNPLSSLF